MESIANVCAICHRAFATRNKLLYHMTMHLDMAAPTCDKCQQPQSMILTPLFVCGRGCMTPLTAPVYDIPHPRPLTPHGETSLKLEDVDVEGILDESLSFESLMNDVMSLENDGGDSENISDTGYAIMSPLTTQTVASPAPTSSMDNGAPLSAEFTPKEASIYSEIEPVKTLSLSDAKKWAMDDVAPLPVPLPWDNTWSSSEPPSASTSAQIYTIKNGSTPVTLKIKQFMVKLAPGRPKGSQSPRAAKPNKLTGLAGVGSSKVKRNYALLPRYGRGLDRQGKNVCLYCNKTFNGCAELDTHIVSAHTTRFTCPLCQSDMLPSSARRHMAGTHPTLVDDKKQVLDNLITLLRHKKMQYNW